MNIFQHLNVNQIIMVDHLMVIMIYNLYNLLIAFIMVFNIYHKINDLIKLFLN